MITFNLKLVIIVKVVKDTQVLGCSVCSSQLRSTTTSTCHKCWD